ncbi:glycosyltransferase family 4 protein [Pseudoalteromonas sp. MMG006]|uniref:glycosyltransferase family 4 protein n=1 Tax=Pseudoalteromonas sp. MMG006 TaxID=2822683 RepID=UPI001B364C19|nr:glycosyltransferase family 4 protein [Pseudoalteromonas sp. MMG006]MBQ4799516.1 glycosyltransferase family 4 protein [Pseudoalteromonas sp. MMG006]
MTKKVLHIFRNLKYGGNQALAYNIIRYSSPEYSHSILSLQDDLEMRNEFESLGCAIKVIPHKESSFSCFKKKYKDFVDESGFCTVVTWFYPFVLRLDIPNVNFVHHIGTAPLKSPAKQWVKNLLLVHFYKRNMGQFVFASDYIQNKNKETFAVNFKNSRVIHNGIDTKRFTPKVTYDHSSSFVITMVGRLDGSKDFDTLINISPEVKKLIPNLQVNIVGDGHDRGRLEQLAHSCQADDVVSFLGRRNDVPEVLQNSDLFVFLNKPLEGFGLVIVEAMSSGLPVISYNLGANAEIIKDGFDGFLVSSKEQLIVKIKEVYQSESLARAIGLEALNTAKRFDVKEMVKKYESLY